MTTMEVAAEHQPDDAYFDLMARVARTHWWYRARRDWLAQEIGGRLPRGEWALDVGCGTGESMARLDALGAHATVGTDLSAHVLGHVVRRVPGTRVIEARAEHLPLRDSFTGCVISMDVIEHLDNDLVALREYHRVLRPGGVVLVTVPAYQWLWSDHDDRAAHRRRYTARQLETVVRTAGFEVDRVTYLFSFLVPPAIVLRRTPVRRFVHATDDEVSMMHPTIDRTFAALARAERALGRRRRLPFGLSILLVGHRPEV
jgi:SAM-dependent methyltransferase